MDSTAWLALRPIDKRIDLEEFVINEPGRLETGFCRGKVRTSDQDINLTTTRFLLHRGGCGSGDVWNGRRFTCAQDAVMHAVQKVDPQTEDHPDDQPDPRIPR
jgi:hypothetical protein